MAKLSEIPPNDTGIAGFTRRLGYDIQNKFVNQGFAVKVTQYSVDKHDDYVLTWTYNRKHSGDIMINKNRKESDNLITICRFLGVKLCRHDTKRLSSSSDELRNAADINDQITSFLEERYGKTISEHDGMEFYKASLEETVSI